MVQADSLLADVHRVVDQVVAARASAFREQRGATSKMKAHRDALASLHRLESAELPGGAAAAARHWTSDWFKAMRSWSAFFKACGSAMPTILPDDGFAFALWAAITKGAKRRDVERALSDALLRLGRQARLSTNRLVETLTGRLAEALRATLRAEHDGKTTGECPRTESVRAEAPAVVQSPDPNVSVIANRFPDPVQQRVVLDAYLLLTGSISAWVTPRDLKRAGIPRRTIAEAALAWGDHAIHDSRGWSSFRRTRVVEWVAQQWRPRSP
ncbi:MAG: hypothetical protein IT454_20030 [Planctomycetes bacterium]|nr:hypothetical protein [Planctomycetota bacterium]